MELLSAYQRRNTQVEARAAEAEARCLILEAAKRSAEKDADEASIRAREAEMLVKRTMEAAERLCRDEEESFDEPAWARRVWAERYKLKSAQLAMHQKAIAEARRFAERAAYDMARDEALLQIFEKRGRQDETLNRAALELQELVQGKEYFFNQIEDNDQQFDAKIILAQRKLAETEAQCARCRESKKQLTREITRAEDTLRLLAIRVDDMLQRENKTNIRTRELSQTGADAMRQVTKLRNEEALTMDRQAAALAVNTALKIEIQNLQNRRQEIVDALKFFKKMRH
uniref:Uncharacterized protein n=1 Tax=Aureoumbra lagunensis TaxID=44058 RepID=A0A7S3K0X2_9STRA